MAVLTEGRHTGEHLISEANGSLSRAAIVVASGAKLEAGTVLGRVTASGKFKILAPGASDGTQTAAGILFDGVDATAADADGVAHVRLAEVKADGLIWPAGITTNQKNAALAQLAAINIVPR